MIKIGLVPIGKIEDKILAHLRTQLPLKLKAENLAVLVHPPLPAPDSRQLKQNNQTLGAAILAAVNTHIAAEPRQYLIAVVDEDLVVPRIEYVLSEIDAGKSLGVVSLARLRQEFYQLPPEEEVFLARLLKIVLQLVGSLMGLERCKDFKCLMSYGRNTHELDLKHTVFCLNCFPKISQKLGPT